MSKEEMLSPWVNRHNDMVFEEDALNAMETYAQQQAKEAVGKILSEYPVSGKKFAQIIKNTFWI